MARFDGFQEFQNSAATFSTFWREILSVFLRLTAVGLSTLSKNVNKAVFQKIFFFKSDRTANFRVFSHLELSKAWKALKKSSLRKGKSDRTPNFRVFSQLELSKAWKALKKTSLRKEKSDRTPNFRVSSQLELSKWQNDKFWSWKSEYLLEQTIF